MLDVRLTTRGDKQVRSFDCLARPQSHANASGDARNRFNLRLLEEGDAFPHHPGSNQSCSFVVLAWQSACGFEHSHLRTKTPVRLRKLHADRSCTNRNQMMGDEILLEDGFIREIRNLL